MSSYSVIGFSKWGIILLYLDMEKVFIELQVTPQMILDVAQKGEVTVAPPPGKEFSWLVIAVNGIVYFTRICLN